MGTTASGKGGGARKRWYVVRCDRHGDKPKGQNYGEVKVGAPKGKSIGRHRSQCPYCVGEREKGE